MDNETETVLLILIICLTTFFIGCLLLSYNIKVLEQPKLEKAFDNCLEGCNAIFNGIGEGNTKEVSCTKECYNFYENKKFTNCVTDEVKK